MGAQSGSRNIVATILTILAILTIHSMLWAGAAFGQTLAVPPDDADALLERGREVYSREGPRAALELYQRALDAYRERSDRLGEAVVLGYIGNCHKHFGDYDRALDLLGRALAIKRRLDQAGEVARTLNHIGLVYWEMGAYDQAIDRFVQAVAIAEERGDRKLQAALLNNLGLVHDERGDYRRSLQEYERALTFERATEDRESEGFTLGNIGGVHFLLGDFRRAIEYYEKAYAISLELDLKPAQSQDLGNLALCHLWLDEVDEALSKLDRALALAREAGLRKEEADWLTVRAGALVKRGAYSDAFRLHREALAIYQQAGMKRELVVGTVDLAKLYLRLGDRLSSRREGERALALAEAIGFERGIQESCLFMGDLLWRLGQRRGALQYYNRAHALAERLGDEAQAAHALLKSGRLEAARGQSVEAKKRLARALELARQRGMRALEALALVSLGELADRVDDHQRALARYDQAIAVATKIADPEVAWRIHHSRGRLLEEMAQPQEAIASYRAASDAIEEVRGRLREELFRAGYMEDKYRVYADLGSLLLERGLTEQAFLVAERSRARAWLDLLATTPVESPATGRAGRKDEERTLRRKIDRLREQLETERAKRANERRKAAISSFERGLADAERQYTVLLGQLRAADPEYASLVVASPLPAASVQLLLAKDEALIEYFLTADRLIAFVVRRAGVTHLDQPIREKRLRKKIELFRDRLRLTQAGTDDWRGPATSLHQLLIAPLEKNGLLDGVGALYVVPQGVLHYFPFAALWNDERAEFLIERYRIAYLPSASALGFCRRKERPVNKLMLALAPASTGLVHARKEATAVGALFDGRARVLSGAGATESFCKEHCGDYRILHFATHGVLDRRNPLFSHIDLEPGGNDDGRLEVLEIMGLKLTADLVTLSACSTALGSGYVSNVPAGDDWVSLTRAFLYAGTPTVVAALWQVDDRSTTELMKSFYRHLAEVDKAEAFARAQRDLLTGIDTDGDAYLRHPFYWAGFAVIGDAH